jgi:hypothetical protein
MLHNLCGWRPDNAPYILSYCSVNQGWGCCKPDPYPDYLEYRGVGEQIHSGDVRLLSVPSTHWLWPEESVRIDRAYPKVVHQPADPLNFLFPDGWWTDFNHCVYDGVVCGTP